MLLTVDELNQIHTLLQEYPDATEVFICSEYAAETSTLVVEFRAGETDLGIMRIEDK